MNNNNYVMLMISGVLRFKNSLMIPTCFVILLGLTPTVIGAVQKLYGIPDTKASVNSLLSFPLPGDAFSGNISHYEVTEVGKSQLPIWLYFDQHSCTLYGVPLHNDVGTHHIDANAVGYDNTSARDTFTITVEKTDIYRSPQGAYQDCVIPTFLSVLIDADPFQLSPKEKSFLITAVANFARIPMSGLRLTDDKKDTAAVAANSKILTKIYWQVGCAGHKVDYTGSKVDFAVVERIENGMKDNTLPTILGFAIVGMELTTDDFTVTPRPRRRHLDVEGSISVHPEPTKSPMTHTRWFDDENIQQIDEEDTTSAIVPDTRVVPTMTSPIFDAQYQQHKTATHPLSAENRQSEPESFNELDIGSGDDFFPDPNRHHHKVHRGKATVLVDGTLMLTPEVTIRTDDYTKMFTSGYVELSSGEFFPPEQSPIVTTPGATVAVYPEETFAIKPSKTYGYITPTAGVDGEVIQNKKPVVKNRLKRFSPIAGKIFRYQIPDNTFFDHENGNTRNLRLQLFSSDGSAVALESWLQFDTAKQELYGLPLEHNVGKWEFMIQALDSEDENAREAVDLLVRQSPFHRAVHHEYALQLRYEKWRFSLDVDWQIKLAERIQAYFGDNRTSDESGMTVRAIIRDPHTTFIWTNDSLPRAPCPDQLINKYYKMMAADDEGTVSKKLKTALQVEFKPQKISVTYLQNCYQPTRNITPTQSTSNKPEVRNPIDHVNATSGILLRFKVPDDTFFDVEDGNTRALRLSFSTIEGVSVPKSSWLHFHTNTHEFIGLPLDDDVGSREYQLVAHDKDGNSVSDALVIVVTRRPATLNTPIRFSVHINYDYLLFNMDLAKKIKVLDKLVGLYGDGDSSYIIVNGISAGSVIFTWSNKTLAGERCPISTAKKLIQYLLSPNGTISLQLKQAFLPEFNVTKVETTPMESCLDEITPTQRTPPAAIPDTERASYANDLLLTTIIPAAILAAMLLITTIVACMLYRRRRRGKMAVDDRTTFASRGIPVIFADELEDRPDPAKAPVVMKEEKPPLPPPEYNRSLDQPLLPQQQQGYHRPSQQPLLPQTQHQRQLQHYHMDGNTEMEPYQPPPPFTSSRDTRVRPKPTPSYRMPPPYVPP